jgi:hypothetical protein
LLLILSVPVLSNLSLGQVNIWLGIFTGEFIRAFLSNKPTKAGIWLAGLLLKPQTLILILPFFLLQHSFKVLKGFAITTFIILLSSLILMGGTGIQNMKNILFEASGGGVSSYPQIMMNWRMLGWHVSSLSNSTTGLIITTIGTLLTVSLIFLVLQKRIDHNSVDFLIMILGIFAATGMTTWHAHLQMSIILIPPMLYLLNNKYLSKKLFIIWIAFPILIKFAIQVLTLFIRMDDQIYQLVEGLRGFIPNLIILIWVINHLYKNKNLANENLITDESLLT